MDNKTIATYDQNAGEFKKTHESQIPLRLYELCKVFFKKGASTADIGCGIGRDTVWLNENGYPAEGFDASEGMLKVARQSYPTMKFNPKSLPALKFDSNFENIFCCAVLMHIPRSSVVESIISLLGALKPNGMLVISFRSGKGETDGRLFETYDSGEVSTIFESHGGKVLLKEKDGAWENMVIQKEIA